MNRAIALVFILLATLLFAACGVIPAVPPSATPPPTPPPTAMPRPATPLPPPSNTPIPPAAAALCPIVATRTPPPGAPTYVPGGPNPPRGPVDPHLEICASAATLRVGDTLTITGVPVDIGLPYYMLLVKDGDSAIYTHVSEVTYENKPRGDPLPSALFEFVSAQASMREVTFVIRATHSGTATVRISASGEIHYGYPGPATFSGGSSDPLLITVKD